MGQNLTSGQTLDSPESLYRGNVIRNSSEYLVLLVDQELYPYAHPALSPGTSPGTRRFYWFIFLLVTVAKRRWAAAATEMDTGLPMCIFSLDMGHRGRDRDLWPWLHETDPGAIWWEDTLIPVEAALPSWTHAQGSVKLQKTWEAQPSIPDPLLTIPPHTPSHMPDESQIIL